MKGVKSPIVIIHGNQDCTFNISQAYKLKALLKPADQLIVLDKQGHNGFTDNKEYLEVLKNIFVSDKKQKPSDVIT